MKIKLNKKEYKALIKGLYIASAMLQSYQLESNAKENKQEALLKKLLGRAEDFGLGHWVEEDEEGAITLSQEKEFDIYEKVQEYEQLLFWTELPYLLAERDLEESLSEEEVLQLSIEEEVAKEISIQEKYEQEFLENGIQNLRVVKSSLN